MKINVLKVIIIFFSNNYLNNFENFKFIKLLNIKKFLEALLLITILTNSQYGIYG